MSDKEFLIKYEKMLDGGYCNCNEMNCIDNNSPRKILNIAKTLQKENEELKERLNKAVEYIEKEWYSKCTININDVVSFGDWRLYLLNILKGED